MQPFISQSFLTCLISSFIIHLHTFHSGHTNMLCFLFIFVLLSLSLSLYIYIYIYIYEINFPTSYPLRSISGTTSSWNPAGTPGLPPSLLPEHLGSASIMWFCVQSYRGWLTCMRSPGTHWAPRGMSSLSAPCITPLTSESLKCLRTSWLNKWIHWQMNHQE